MGPLPPPPPTPTPAPPSIPFKFIGSFGPRERPIAVLAAGDRLVNARAGDVVFDRFILRKVGYESIDVGYVGFAGELFAAAGDREMTAETARFPAERAIGAMKVLRIGLAGSRCWRDPVGCTAYRNYSQAKDDEALQHWDLAVLKLEKAVELDPNNPQYKLALIQLKLKVSQVHFEKGKLYRASGNPELAVVELEQTVLLDPTNDYAEVELRKAREDAAKLAAERNSDTEARRRSRRRRAGARARAPLLEPASDKPISLNFPAAQADQADLPVARRCRGDQRDLRPAVEGRQRLDRADEPGLPERRSRLSCGRRTTSTR